MIHVKHLMTFDLIDIFCSVPKTPSVDEDECVVERNTILFKWTSDLTLVTSSSNTAPEECMVSFVVEYKKVWMSKVVQKKKKKKKKKKKNKL